MLLSYINRINIFTNSKQRAVIFRLMLCLEQILFGLPYHIHQAGLFSFIVQLRWFDFALRCKGNIGEEKRMGLNWILHSNHMQSFRNVATVHVFHLPVHILFALTL